MAKQMLDLDPPSGPATDPSLVPPALPGAGRWETPDMGARPPAEVTLPPPLPGGGPGGGGGNLALPASLDAAAAVADDDLAAPRRVARRRPAAPAARGRVAANDDGPSVGGLIMALEQKPSSRPFNYAAIFSGLWGLLGFGIAGLHIMNELERGVTAAVLVTSPTTLITVASVFLPIGVVWFLALLAWRAEELRLRSSTMTEVAVRLAEPDRMAEQSVASLGQSVRRQVSFMNDAVSRALGRAGELEALVHAQVSQLERSYEENESRIRGLIQELSGERHALLNTSERVAITLRTLGSEVPGLIDELSDQQIKLSEIINAAGRNLSSLEAAITHGAGQLETTLGSRSAHLQGILEGSASRIEVALSSHAEGLDRQIASHRDGLVHRLTGHTDEFVQQLTDQSEKLVTTLTGQSQTLALQLTDQSEQMQVVLESYTGALAEALATRTDQMQAAFEDQIRTLDTSIARRTEHLQSVFQEYAHALDTTLANRAQALDVRLVQRTAALDSAFNQRLQLFDDSIRRSTQAIDSAVSERAAVLTTALDAHAKTFRETITRQSAEIDESIMHGINSVRRSSENITRQSLKAIEGLAGQSEMLRSISENLLGQINSVTNRFENQGQQIMKAANALESANYNIDATLQARHTDLSQTLDRISGSADNFGKVLTHYTSSIEGTVSEAEKKARQAAEELRSATEYRSRAALTAMEQLSAQTAQTTAASERSIEDLRRRLSSASGDVASEIGNLTSRLDDTTNQLRTRSTQAASEIADEQQRLRAQLEMLPRETRATAETMRRSLQDQLAALEQLQDLAGRTAAKRDIAPPVALGGNAGGPPPGPGGGYPSAPVPLTPVGMAPPAAGGLSGLLRGQNAQPGQGQGGDRWSVGDLLARASFDDDHDRSPSGGSAPFALNVGTLARALDPAAADAIWTRLRRGERGIMARSIYSHDGRLAYDEISMRVKTDDALQDTITRFLADFERVLRDAEALDPSGSMVQKNLISDNGRVYLFLAHASGRLA